MKKVFSILIFCIVALNVTGQVPTSDCEAVAMKGNELEGKYSYSTPEDLVAETSVSATRIVTPNVKSTLIHFVLYAEIANYSATGVFVKFDNGEILKFPDENVTCNFMSRKKGYLYQGFITITESNKDLFLNNRVVKFSLSGNEREVSKSDAENLIKYLPCIIDKS